MASDCVTARLLFTISSVVALSFSIQLSGRSFSSRMKPFSK